MGGRTRQQAPTPAPQAPAPAESTSETPVPPWLSLGIPPLQLDPNLLGNQGMLDLQLRPDLLGGEKGLPGPRTQGPTPGGPFDFSKPTPTRDPGLPMPFLDKVPFGGKIRGTLNDWLRDPYGKNAPQPPVVDPPGAKKDDDPCRVSTNPQQCRKDTSPTMIKTPSIPIPGT